MDTDDVAQADTEAVDTSIAAGASEEVEASSEADTSTGEEAQQADDQSESTEEGQSEETPVEYTDFNVPEGFEALDEALLAKATPLLQEIGATQEQAQSFVDMFAESLQGQAESQSQAFTEANEENKKACIDHAEYGGDKFDKSVSHCAKAIHEVMGAKADEFRGFLNATGLGNHPMMFELLAKVGNSIAEDGIVEGSKVVAKADQATTMYGEDGKGAKT